jgi:hypothetical protein
MAEAVKPVALRAAGSPKQASLAVKEAMESGFRRLGDINRGGRSDRSGRSLNRDTWALIINAALVA